MKHIPINDLIAPKYTFRFPDGSVPSAPNHKTQWASDKSQVMRAAKTWGATEIIALSETGEEIGCSVL